MRHGKCGSSVLDDQASYQDFSFRGETLKKRVRRLKLVIKSAIFEFQTDSHYENETKSETFLMKMRFFSHKNKKSFSYQELGT